MLTRTRRCHNLPHGELSPRGVAACIDTYVRARAAVCCTYGLRVPALGGPYLPRACTPGRRWFEVDDYRRTLSYYATEVKALDERPSCVLQVCP